MLSQFFNDVIAAMAARSAICARATTARTMTARTAGAVDGRKI